MGTKPMVGRRDDGNNDWGGAKERRYERREAIVVRTTGREDCVVGEGEVGERAEKRAPSEEVAEECRTPGRTPGRTRATWRARKSRICATNPATAMEGELVWRAKASVPIIDAIIDEHRHNKQKRVRVEEGLKD